MEYYGVPTGAGDGGMRVPSPWIVLPPTPNAESTPPSCVVTPCSKKFRADSVNPSPCLDQYLDNFGSKIPPSDPERYFGRHLLCWTQGIPAVWGGGSGPSHTVGAVPRFPCPITRLFGHSCAEFRNGVGVSCVGNGGPWCSKGITPGYWYERKGIRTVELAQASLL